MILSNAKLSELKLTDYKQLSEIEIANTCQRIAKDQDYLKKFPIVCSTRNGKLSVIQNIETYMAANRLMLDDVPVAIAKNLTRQQERKLKREKFQLIVNR